MALNEELVALEAFHSLYVERLAVQYGNDAIPFIDDMSEKITNRINREVGKNLTALRREKLLKDIADIVKDDLKAYTVELHANDAALGKYEADWQSSTVHSLYPAAEAVTVGKSVINAAAKNTLIQLGGDTYTSYQQMLSNYTRVNAEQITNIVGQGFQSGVTTREIANEVLNAVDNRVVKTRKEAMTIARTGTTHYANQGRKEYFNADPIVIGTRRIATLDSDTSSYCRSIDNTVVLKTDSNYRKAFAPFHPRCRTSNTPEVDSRFKHEDDGERRPENFRDAETGLLDPKQTSSKDIFYEAFKSLDAKTQDQQVGVRLGAAFRKGIKDGTLTPSSFAKQTVSMIETRPLTLKELERADNALGRILRQQKR